MCQTLNNEDCSVVPSWAGFNSLLSEVNSATKCQLLPLYSGPPTDWSNLLTALKIVQGINLSVANFGKTIVTFDLQLYSMCVKLHVQTWRTSYPIRDVESYWKVHGKQWTRPNID